MPFVLGFHPTNSIMVVCVTDHRLGLFQRLDLPRPENVHVVGSALLPALIGEEPEVVILLGFEDHKDDSLPTLELLTAALGSQDVQIPPSC